MVEFPDGDPKWNPKTRWKHVNGETATTLIDSQLYQNKQRLLLALKKSPCIIRDLVKQTGLAQQRITQMLKKMKAEHYPIDVDRRRTPSIWFYKK